MKANHFILMALTMTDEEYLNLLLRQLDKAKKNAARYNSMHLSYLKKYEVERKETEALLNRIDSIKNKIQIK